MQSLLSIMAEVVTPYGAKDRTKKEQVEEMFDNIAGRYDFLNRLLSLGIDITWRKKAVRFLVPAQPMQLLDVATGTGDFAFELLSLSPKKIIGYDLSAQMIAVGEKKAKEKKVNEIVTFVKGDSENMPFESNSFDAITVGFGVRNFENLEKGLSEMHRVLKNGGKVAILEISRPHNAIVRTIYDIYFRYILPVVGKLFSKDVRAYNYLPESVVAFPQGIDFVAILDKIGFKNAQWQPLTLGTCALYTCEK